MFFLSESSLVFLYLRKKKKTQAQKKNLFPENLSF